MPTLTLFSMILDMSYRVVVILKNIDNYGQYTLFRMEIYDGTFIINENMVITAF